MKIIENNPALTLHAIEDKIETYFVTLMVNPYRQIIANELLNYFIPLMLKKEKVTIEKAIEKHLYNFKVIVEPKMKKDEWQLITENEIYYSKGDNIN